MGGLIRSDQAGYVDKLKKEGKPIPMAIMSGIKNE